MHGQNHIKLAVTGSYVTLGCR